MGCLVHAVLCCTPCLYDGCTLLLHQAGKEDPRIQFNTVLSEHAKAGFKEPLALRDRIVAIRNSVKER